MVGEVNAKQERIKFEEELQKMKVQLNTDQLAEKNQNEGIHQASTNSMQSKLPELVITKFDRSRFWAQFSGAIDKTIVAPITKFTYLRELVDTKVGRTIEALPFTTEGYNRAKSILQDKFGKEHEIIKPYTKEILDGTEDSDRRKP